MSPDAWGFLPMRAVLPGTRVARDMWRATALVAGAAAVAASGAAGAVKPPTPKELLMGLQPPPAVVTGLAYPIIPYSPPKSTAPTPRQCVAAWNRGAPRRTLAWVVARSARRADVTLFTEGVQTLGGGPAYSVSSCAFGIAIAPTQILYALAPPKGTTRPFWSGELLNYQSPSTVTRLVRRFNATVSRDGTLRLG